MKLTIAIALAVVSAHGLAQGENHAVRKQAEAFFMKADMMMNSNRAGDFANLLHPSFVWVGLQGERMTAKQFKAAVTNWSRTSRKMNSKTRIHNVQLQDMEVVVWTQQVITYEAKRNGKWMPIKDTTRWAETLRMTDGGWKLAFSQQLPMDEKWSFKTNGG